MLAIITKTANDVTYPEAHILSDAAISVEVTGNTYTRNARQGWHRNNVIARGAVITIRKCSRTQTFGSAAFSKAL
jgi:hypothetical protein